jgi:type VI secretion system secreted protein Hcp
MAMDMFLEIEGVEGESVDSSKEGAIDILAWSWGASQSPAPSTRAREEGPER